MSRAANPGPREAVADLQLEDILTPAWLAALGPVIRAQPDAARFLGPGREWTIPAREHTFRALLDREPHEWNVVVVGQDPYPREQSAIGIAFNDGAIANWTDRMSPSFQNIAKAAMAHAGLMDASGKIKELRAAVKRGKVLAPPAWFDSLQAQGVAWLNRALTFSSTDVAVLRQHTAFWRPIIEAIFQTIVDAKRARGGGLVVVMWGGYAQEMQPVIEAINAAGAPVPIEFVANAHPAATGASLARFHASNSMDAVAAALEGFGAPAIDWAPTAAGGASAGGGGAGAASAGGGGAAAGAGAAAASDDEAPSRTPLRAQGPPGTKGRAKQSAARQKAVREEKKRGRRSS